MTLTKQTHRIHAGTDPVQRQFTELADRVDELLGILALDGILLEGLSLGAGVTAVEHQLGRTPRGLIVVRQTGTSVVQWVNDATDTTIELTSAGAQTVSVWVF